MEIKYTAPSAQQYIDLRIDTKMGSKNIDNVQVALDNSLFIVCLWHEDKLVGFGRIIGDKAISYALTDIMVASSHQGQGLGNVIMDELNKYLDDNSDEDGYIILLAKKPADKLYEKNRFEDLSPNFIGMKRK